MKKIIIKILFLIAIILDVGWIWFILNFTLFGAEINYLERIPAIIPFIAILFGLITLFIKISKPFTIKSVLILICIIFIAPTLFYLGLIGADKLSNFIDYNTATCGTIKITESVPMSQWRQSNSYEITCDDFIPENDTNNLYVYHEYTSPWGNKPNGQTYWGYIFPNNTVNYTDYAIGDSGTTNDEPLVMKNGCRYTIEEIKKEDIGQYAKEHNPLWDTISEIKETDGYVSGVVFNDTYQKINATHKYNGKEVQIEIEPYTFVLLNNGRLTFDEKE